MERTPTPLQCIKHCIRCNRCKGDPSTESTVQWYCQLIINDAYHNNESGPAIDPDTACVACGKQDEPEAMLICDSCQQGHHLTCYGLAAIPEEDEWVCAGCAALQGLQQGSSIVLESPQSLYADGSDSHLTQGLFKGVVRSLGPTQQDSAGSFRQVQAEMALAPEADSLIFYSNSTYKRLLKPPKAFVQLAEHLYNGSGLELSTVTLSSNRSKMFGGPAAAAGCATEAWCLDDDSAVQHALTQPGKQDYLLLNKTTQAAGRTTAAASAEVTAVEPGMQPAGFVVQQLQPAGFAAPQAHTAGFAAQQLQPASFAAQQLQPASFAAQQLQPASFAAQQLQPASFAAQQLQPTAAAAPLIPQMQALQNWYPMPYYPPMMHSASQPTQMQDIPAGTQALTTPPVYPMQFGYPTAQMPYPYHPMIMS